MADIKGIELASDIYGLEDEESRSGVQGNASAIGDLDDLETTEKTSIVGAINENVANISNIAPFARKQELLSKYNRRRSQKTVPYSTTISYSEDVFSFYGASGVVDTASSMNLIFTVTKQGILLTAQVARSGAIPSVGALLGGVYLAIGKNKIKELLIELGTTATEQAELTELYELLSLDFSGTIADPTNVFQGEPGVECLVMPNIIVTNYPSTANLIAKQVYFSYGYVFAVISAGSYSGSVGPIAKGIVVD